MVATLKEAFENNIFDDIYSNKSWGNGSIHGGSSGPGSNYESNIDYLYYLNNFIKKNQIKNITDIGCGDWQMMSKINLENIEYNGYDVSKNVIDINNKRFKKNNINFIHNDLDYNLSYKSADLLICKDVIQHLSYKNINKIISQFYKYKYIFIINDIQNSSACKSCPAENSDIVDGGYRHLDIRKSPFNIKNIYNVLHLWKNMPDKTLLLLINPYF